MTRMIITLGAAMLCSTVIATTVSARDGGGREALPDFSEIDQNNDGAITPDELDAVRQGRFARVDTDGDGFLSLAELQAAASERGRKRAERMIERLDDDNDGRLSREELQDARSSRIFERADRDNNGSLSEEELSNLIERARGRHGRRGHGWFN